MIVDRARSPARTGGFDHDRRPRAIRGDRAVVPTMSVDPARSPAIARP
jgi:hypothetical protein